MKRYIFIITLALATTLSAAAQKTIEILHTNDTHSCIMPLNPNLAVHAVRFAYLTYLIYCFFLYHFFVS